MRLDAAEPQVTGTPGFLRYKSPYAIAGGKDARECSKLSQAGRPRARPGTYAGFSRLDWPDPRPLLRSRSPRAKERPVDLAAGGSARSRRAALPGLRRGNSNWVRNTRTAGEVVLVRAMRRRRYLARELPPDMRPPILKAYLDRFASVLRLTKDSLYRGIVR
jgi:hypothetical protein